MTTEDYVKTLYEDGIVALKGAFSVEWIESMHEDMMTAFWSAIQRPGGAVSRGPRRWYVEIHPQDFRGFAELASHPWVVEMASAVCGA
ncbi:MAG: phytanoyl-CoA dioxygenase, partial [Pseudomonadota bacterium]|nr:phytanoyl-CoA dioxygenase [Pseudomonadota bacterium]